MKAVLWQRSRTNHDSVVKVDIRIEIYSGIAPFSL